MLERLSATISSTGNAPAPIGFLHELAISHEDQLQGAAWINAHSTSYWAMIIQNATQMPAANSANASMAPAAHSRATVVDQMRALRARAIASGMKLKSLDAINEEVRALRERES